VPLAGGELKGVDALYSVVQMPPGIPVACVGVGVSRNAAYLAAEILGIKYEKIREAYENYRLELQGEQK
jgi:5-(carboxyamino)imidazole ribonucleotide mutase